MNTQRSVPVGEAILGRWLDAYGRPIDNGTPIDDGAPRRSLDELFAATTVHDRGMLETGIKAIDFYAPLTRGGVAVVEGPLGTGMTVIVMEVMYNLQARSHGRCVMAVVDAAGLPARELFTELRGAGIAPSTVLLSAAEGDAHAHVEAVLTAQWMAAYFVDQGHETVLALDEALLDRARGERLSAGAYSGPTTLVWRQSGGDEAATPRVSDPDAVVTLRLELARSGIYPAVDGLASRSLWLDQGAGSEHHDTVARVRELLQQHDLAAAGSTGQAGRAGRALLFQTQPFSVAEPYTARPGVYVDAVRTVAGFAAVADGAYDAVAESELTFIGAAPA